MRRVAVALLCATGAALVTPPTARRPSALAASATAEVPVKTFDGADSGKATLNLKVTKGEKDMYVVHRKYVLERRNRARARPRRRRGPKSGAAAASPSSK